MNKEIANKIFDAMYDEDDLKELKNKKVIAQELGFKLSTVAIIECELDEHYKKLLEFVRIVADADVTTKTTEDKAGFVTQTDVISYLYKAMAENILMEIEK